MRVSLGVALGAALLVAGAVAPGVSTAPTAAAASPDAAASPGPSSTASVTARAADVSVTAKISLPAGSSVNGSITGTLTITHDGTSSSMKSGRITMVDPDNRELLGESFVAGGAADTWTSTVPLPADAAPGVYQVSLDARVAITTDEGVTEVPIRTQTPISVPFRALRNIPLIWTSPSSAPAGSTISVHGAANVRSLGTGEYEPATGQEVKLYFDPEGSAPETLRATLTTDSRGYFTSRQKPGASGKWRAEMAQTDTGARTVWTITSAERTRSTTLRQGQVRVTQGGYTAGDHLMTHDVVVGLAPVSRRVDVGSLNFSMGGMSGFVSAESRRGEGSYPDGYRMQRELVHAGIGTSHVTLTFNPTLPAGVYDIGIRDAMKACAAPDWDGLDGGTSNCTHDVLVEDPTVTTLVVKRASSTTVTASRTSLPAPGSVTLSGGVRKVQLVSGGGAQERPAPNTKVEIYFDPAGSAAPVLKKTVTTGSNGNYSTSVSASATGAWIAKYPGTSLQAPSQASVNVTVG
ncbi:hypothetical protein APR03_002600 [Promicromonospora thailandica]|uniref:Ig-like domain-containing protein n=2 Tax=Promicromonospora thailandica TaxID=765201 RepID=A0A9X2G1C0_9MICO|nr:hypothetical protein [Promicromonospora thailandica]